MVSQTPLTVSARLIDSCLVTLTITGLPPKDPNDDNDENEEDEEDKADEDEEEEEPSGN